MNNFFFKFLKENDSILFQMVVEEKMNISLLKNLVKGMVLDFYFKLFYIFNMLDVKFKWYMFNQLCLNIDFELLLKLFENIVKEFRNN